MKKLFSLLILLLIIVGCNTTSYHQKESVVESGYKAFTNELTFTSNSNYKFLPGNYYLKSEAGKSIYLLEGLENLVIDGKETALFTQTDNSIFELKNCKNIVIKNFISLGSEDYGIIVDNCENIKIINSSFRSHDQLNDKAALEITNSSDISLFNNNFTGFKVAVLALDNNGIKIVDGGFNFQEQFSIKLVRNSSVEISRNLIENRAGSSIFFEDIESFKIKENLFKNGSYGVIVKSSKSGESRGLIKSNHFRNIKKTAIESENLSQIDIYGNSIETLEIGVQLDQVTKSSIISNKFNYNSVASLKSINCETTMIDSNYFYNSTTGIDLKAQKSGDFEIYNNYFEGNIRDIYHLGVKSINLNNNQFVINHANRKFNSLTVKKYINDELLEKILRFKIECVNPAAVKKSNNTFTLIDTIMGDKIILNPFRKRWSSSSETEIPELFENSASWLAQTSSPDKVTIFFDKNSSIHKNSSLALRSRSKDTVFLEYIPRRKNYIEWQSSEIKKIQFWCKILKVQSSGLKEITLTFKNMDGMEYMIPFNVDDLNSSQGEWVLFKKELTTKEMEKLPGIINGLEFTINSHCDDYTLWIDNLEMK